MDVNIFFFFKFLSIINDYQLHGTDIYLNKKINTETTPWMRCIDNSKNAYL